MKSTKETLRRVMRARMAALDAATVGLAGRNLIARLRDFPPYRDADFLLAYVAMANEVPTVELIAEACAGGKSVYLPTVRSAWFASYQPGEALRAGPSGVFEPVSGTPLEASDRRGIILAPLLGWSLRGDRLGRGGGWYDRVLPRLAMTPVGVGYEFQERAHVPTEPSDVRLDYVVTESRLVECGRVLSERRLS